MSDVIERARHAQRLLEDPLIAEFFEVYKRTLFERWLNTPDKEERDEIYRLQIAADAFKLHLVSYLADGKIAMKREEYDAEE